MEETIAQLRFHPPSRRWLTGLLLALAVSPALRAAAATPTPAAARLEGKFVLKGRVTAARAVRGEHVGQKVTRIWTFTSGCPSGACPRVGLARARSGGSDLLLLRRRGPGYYVGSGSFFAPLRCAGRTYRRGALVPFTITVRVTRAALAGSLVVATRINATYTNRSRRNLTPCVAVLGHDAAIYRGQVAPAPL